MTTTHDDLCSPRSSRSATIRAFGRCSGTPQPDGVSVRLLCGAVKGGSRVSDGRPARWNIARIDSNMHITVLSS